MVGQLSGIERLLSATLQFAVNNPIPLHRSVLVGRNQIKNAITATKIRSNKRPIQRAALLRFIRIFTRLMHQVFGDSHNSALLGC
jgi:hypothetical protein